MLFSLPIPSSAVINTQKRINDALYNQYVSSINDNVAFLSLFGSKSLLKTLDGGTSWSQLALLDFYPFEMQFIDNDVAYSAGVDSITSYTAKVYKTTNGGTTFTEIFSVPNYANGSRLRFYDKSTGFLCNTSKKYLYTTTDEGSSWISYEVDSGDVGIYSVFPVSAEVIFATGDERIASVDYATIYKSTDGGKTWVQKYITTEASTSGTGIIAVDSSNLFQITRLSLFEGRLLKSTDGGETWQTVYKFLGIPNAVYFKNENVGWMGGARSVSEASYGQCIFMRTLNGGISWESVLPQEAQGYYSIIYNMSGTGGSSKFWASTSNYGGAPWLTFANEPPTISQVAPASVPVGSTEVIKITGENFETISEVFGTRSTIEISGSGITIVSATVNSTTEITAEVTVSNSAAYGPRTLTVYNPDTSSTTSSIILTEPVAGVKINSISPSSFNAGTTGFINIYGTGFQASASLEETSADVSLSGFVIKSATEALAYINVLDSAATGTLVLSLVNPDGSSASSNIAILSQSAPAPEAKVAPSYDNGKWWNPETSTDLKLQVNPAPQSGEGQIVVAPPSTGQAIKVPATFSNGAVTIRKSDMANTANGIYPMAIIKNGKVVGRTKVVIYRGK